MLNQPNNFPLEPTKQRKFNPRLLIFILLFLLLGISGVFAFLFFQPLKVPSNQTYEIASGATSESIARDLKAKGIITYPLLFTVYAKISGLDTKFKAGRFTFPEQEINLIQLVKFLTSKARAKEVQFTIPEGYTMEQIVSLLEIKLGLDKDSSLLAIKEFPISNYQFLISKQIPNPKSQIPNSSLEGYLFPDTYRVYEDATVEEIIKKMLDNFDRKVAIQFGAKIESSGKTLNEIIIMASILEREVRTEGDMKMVSDILWRRLSIGKPLEVDSTLNYILDDKRPALTFKELAIDSPYNTYKYKGLPPTPIGNPGLKAITAALSPSTNEYWFYLSKPSGETVFAKTLEEHAQNKRRFLE